MSSNESGADGSCGNARLTESRSDFLQLQKFLQNIQNVMEERFQTMEVRFAKIEEGLSHEQGRNSKLEESVRRALDDVMPKVEELLGRHLSPQPSREAALGHVAPAVASAAPNSTAPTNADSPVGMPQQNLQHGLLAGGDRALPQANASASTKPTECALVTDGGGQATVPPAPSSEGAAPASRPSAPPPSAASGATNPAASLHEAAERGDAAAVQRFLADGARVDARDKDGNTALHHAASNGRTEVVEILIAKGAAVNRRGLRSRTPLHCAVAKGHETIVARLVTAGAKLDSRDADGATAAALAAQGGHAEVVLWLLDQGTPVEARDKEGRTLLMYAVEEGNLQLVKDLLGKGANMKTVDNKGETCLLMGVKKGRLHIVKYLLEKNASPFTVDKSNEYPLLLSSKKGYGDVVEKMLQMAGTGDKNLLERSLCAAGSADVVWSFADEAHDLVLGQAGGEALVEAARDRRLEVVEALLLVGVNAKASLEMALRAAAEKGRRGCIVALLDAGVDVNARDIEMELTALHHAAVNGHAECVEVLLQRGDKNDQSTGEVLVNAAYWGRLDVLKILLRGGAGAKESREEALRAAAHGGHRACIVALLDAGVDVNARDIKTKLTALCLAAMNGHAECVEVLLQRGDKNDQSTEEVLVNAAYRGRLDVLKILLREGASAKKSREEALRVAAKKGHKGCIVALLDAGVDVNARDNWSTWTALHFAAWYAHAECVKELLQRGATKELKDNVGRTALSLARTHNKAACIDILKN
ncbi:hypothetical protein R5R35_013260 [Gryllus longicercus]|uniref:Uncharacterized protein n=1 Tax=Gryllus longicercus TaxID=2509291 RepID=A0AAN9W0B2_9ORTH